MNMRVTIKDVAKVLGVSITTVSRALSDKSDVSEQTKARVRCVAEQMGYTPNPIALSLQNRQSRTIGIVVPEFINSFFSKIIISVQDLLYRKGYQLIIMQSNESAEVEARNLSILQNSVVAGILISPTKEGQNMELYQSIIDSGTPIVFFNRSVRGMEASRVVIDDFKMSFFATEHLIYSGRRNIAYLAGPDTMELSRVRKDGYLKALKKHNVDVDESLIITTGLLMECGYDATLSLLDRGEKFDAIYAVCDPVAIGAMKALKERGVKIPEDVAVVGFSESRSATLIEPNLTSVAQPLAQMGEIAAELLLKQIDMQSKGETTPNDIIVLDAKLNIRESSRSLK